MVSSVSSCFFQWHLGFHKREFTPLYRGFESHYGYYLGCGDYYDHTSEANEVIFDGKSISLPPPPPPPPFLSMVVNSLVI